MTIHYVKGDATRPPIPGIIAHVCNDIGLWGTGFVLALSRVDKAPERAYRKKQKHRRGEVTFIPFADTHLVANMVAQKGIARGAEKVLDERALTACLTKVAVLAETKELPIHMPRIGCGLAGGSWRDVEAIILSTCGNVDVYVYDYGRPNYRR